MSVSAPMLAAIAGSEVAMTVESICSMKSATARMSGVTRITKAGVVEWQDACSSPQRIFK